MSVGGSLTATRDYLVGDIWRSDDRLALWRCLITAPWPSSRTASRFLRARSCPARPMPPRSTRHCAFAPLHRRACADDLGPAFDEGPVQSALFSVCWKWPSAASVRRRGSRCWSFRKGPIGLALVSASRTIEQLARSSAGTAGQAHRPCRGDAINPAPPGRNRFRRHEIFRARLPRSITKRLINFGRPARSGRACREPLLRPAAPRLSSCLAVRPGAPLPAFVPRPDRGRRFSRIKLG